MSAYIIRRLLLIVPTLLAIMVINFAVIQFAPGGPVERIISQMQGFGGDLDNRMGGDSGDIDNKAATNSDNSAYRGAQGLDPAFIAELEQQFGFDKPAHERFFSMIGNFLTLDFGNSFYRDESVINIILEKMPVSISLGLWTTLLVYLISIPLGIKKAINDGNRFDLWTSAAIVVAYAIPGFLVAILLIVLFAGGAYWDFFPLRGLVSDNWSELGMLDRMLDYFWHLTLPITAMVISGFASLTMLTKNSFLDEINKQYVTTARAKGLSERRVLYNHVFRNAMLIVIAGFPAAFIGILFTGSMLIEVIFSLDGLGLLGFESALNRDYPVVFGTLFIFTLLGLVLNLVGDVMYMLIDPRIDFEQR